MEQMCFKPFKRFKIKVRQLLRRDVFYHDFSGCCHTVPVNKDQFFLFSRSRVLLFQNLQFYTSPGISKKKNLKINKTWVWSILMVETFCEYHIKVFFFPTMFALIYSCILLIQFLLFTIIFQNIFLQLRYKVKERLSSIFCMIKWHLKTK